MKAAVQRISTLDGDAEGDHRQPGVDGSAGGITDDAALFADPISRHPVARLMPWGL